MFGSPYGRKPTYPGFRPGSGQQVSSSRPDGRTALSGKTISGFSKVGAGGKGKGSRGLGLGAKFGAKRHR